MNCFDTTNAHLARRYDAVVDELDGCLCLRKVSTIGGSTDMENDWLWIPAYRSRVQMQQHTPGRTGYVSPNKAFIRFEEVETHPMVNLLRSNIVGLNGDVSALRDELNELKKEIADLRAGQPRLGDSVSTTASRRLTL